MSPEDGSLRTIVIGVPLGQFRVRELNIFTNSGLAMLVGDVPGVCDERQLFGMRLTGREHKPQHDEKSPMSHNCPLSINLRLPDK
jgi:hypothetical protein